MADAAQAPGVNPTINYLNGSLLIGIFLNNFLPSSIGGDTYRAYDAAQLKNSSWPKSLTVILMERGTGVIALVCFVMLSLFLGFSLTDLNSIFVVVIILFVVFGIFLILLLNPRLLKPLNFLFKIKFMRKIKDKLRSIMEALTALKNKKVLVLLVFLSFLMQFNVILHYYFAALALKIDISFVSFLFMVPIVLLVAMIPISIGGIGIRENTTAYFLTSFGVLASKAAIFPLLILFMLLAESIIGGIMFLIRKPKITNIRQPDKK
ncbi:MAG: lysylphosphatidylglycerol synthase transmembrane domain-containing protein [Actinomycetota bacterium]|nr:lysylphosphatidylglycerol synthase transmembrane domain-containing protein [Actinomycetota bacterium]